MSNLLLVYTVMDAWREKYHSIFIVDDDDSNIICIDCRKCILHKKTVSKTVIGQIKDIINKTDIASFKYKPCDKDDCFTDGVINHFFINDGEKLKEIEHSEDPKLLKSMYYLNFKSRVKQLETLKKELENSGWDFGY